MRHCCALGIAHCLLGFQPLRSVACILQASLAQGVVQGEVFAICTNAGSCHPSLQRGVLMHFMKCSVHALLYIRVATACIAVANCTFGKCVLYNLLTLLTGFCMVGRMSTPSQLASTKPLGRPRSPANFPGAFSQGVPGQPETSWLDVLAAPPPLVHNG